MAISLKRGGWAGFTLLELLVALAITSIVLAGVYRVVDGTAHNQRILEQRQEQLHLWMYVRRLLQSDWAQRLDPSDKSLLLGRREESDTPPDSVTLHCSGSVVPGRALGARVEVSYIWEKNLDNEGVSWVREVRSQGQSREVPALNFRIGEGLESVTFAVLDKEGWKRPDETMEPPLRAVRWQLHWSMIGSWTLIQHIVF